jgi:hypothetical protein
MLAYHEGLSNVLTSLRSPPQKSLLARSDRVVPALSRSVWCRMVVKLGSSRPMADGVGNKLT